MKSRIGSSLPEISHKVEWNEGQRKPFVFTTKYLCFTVGSSSFSLTQCELDALSVLTVF